MLCTRLYFGRHTEHARMFEAVSAFEVVIPFVEDEERLVGDPGQTRFEAGIQCVKALIERFQIALVSGRVRRVYRAEVRGHFCSDDPGVVWRQPQVGIQGAGAMIVIMLGRILIMRMTVFSKMAQFETRQGLNRHRRRGTPRQHPRQEPFHVRANPVQQVCGLHPPYVGGAQRKAVGRCIGRQQHFGLAHTVLYSRGNQLQGLDAGQHVNVRLNRANHQKTGTESKKNRKKTGHDEHSEWLKRVT